MSTATYKVGTTFKVVAYVNYSCGEDAQIHVGDGLEIIKKKFKLEPRCEGAKGNLIYTVLAKSPCVTSAWKEFTYSNRPKQTDYIKVYVVA